MKKSEVEDVLRQIAQLVKRFDDKSESTTGGGGYENPMSPIHADTGFKMGDALAARDEQGAVEIAGKAQHVYRNSVCSTDKRGHAQPESHSPLDIVLDASEGFVPLWAQGVNLRWRFNEPSMGYFQNPAAAKNAIEGLLAQAMNAWGDAAPVQLSHRTDNWDFEVVMMSQDNCTANGCTLARLGRSFRIVEGTSW